MRLVKIFILFLLVIVSVLFMANLEFSGLVYHNDILARKYKIHGIDISHHQTRINWSKVDKKYKFVIMKATEGQDFLDTDFHYNWNKAQFNGFIVGAYHFFTMTSKGENQAKFYISKVQKLNNTFPPIVDFELARIYDKNDVLKELEDFIKVVENYYGRKVIIYANYNSYNYYLKNKLKDNKIWIRDIKWYPNIEEDDRWIIWQYSNRGIVKGIDGFTDKNALRYSSFDNYIK